MVGHFLYPSGLTATSPKIGEDGRSDTSGGWRGQRRGWCGDMGKWIFGSGAGDAGRCGWYGYEYELTYDLWTGDAGCV